MQETNLILGILNISCGALFILVSIPLVMKKVPMNNWYGFRIPKAYESLEAWYEINHYGGRQMIQWSILLVFIGALYFTFPIDRSGSDFSNMLMATGPIVICPTVAIVKTILFSRQL